MAIILIVEDEPFIQEVAKLTLEDLGHTTFCASDVDEALFVLCAAQHIDALFTDIRLKSAVFGGYELAHQATKLRPHLRVLYASGNSTTDRTKALFVVGAGFVEKPYSPGQLQAAMEILLASPDELARHLPSP